MTTVAPLAATGASAPVTQRLPDIISKLQQAYPSARLSINYSNSLELLIATILVGKSTEKEVNMVTQSLFSRFKTPEQFIEASRMDIERILRPLRFYRQKAKHIQLMCQVLVQRHGGRVPTEMNDLVKLPGIARKAANTVIGEINGQADGVAVDMHVTRISKRLGLARGKSAETIERQLKEVLPTEHWSMMPHWMARHGEECCNVRAPQCTNCPLMALCPSAQQIA